MIVRTLTLQRGSLKILSQLVAKMLAISTWYLLCLSSRSCGLTTYQRESSDGTVYNCDKCLPGTHLGRHCTENSKTVCKPCREGTYTAYFNYMPNCLRCTSCRGPGEIELTPCEKHRNRVCVCKDGYYRDGVLETCVKHSSCPAGQGVETRGTSLLDTKCKYCSEGTYSSESSAVGECLTHRLCSDHSFVALEGMTVYDTVCGNCSKSADDHISPLVLVILKGCKIRFRDLKKLAALLSDGTVPTEKTPRAIWSKIEKWLTVRDNELATLVANLRVVGLRRCARAIDTRRRLASMALQNCESPRALLAKATATQQFKM